MTDDPQNVPDEVVNRTREMTADLSNRMLQPRLVDADFMWGMFITNRSFVGGWSRQVDPDHTTRMLEMWHAGSPCYSALEAEVAGLGNDNSLPPLEFVLYVDHLTAQLSPCVDEQLSLVDGRLFFHNPADVRTQRITTWFDRTWQDADDGTFPFAADCRDGFYSHLPVAIAASDARDLESAWASAMVVVSQCARAAMQDYFAFLQVTPSRLFELQPHDRYTTISLQMTMYGHLISVDLRKPNAQCWPDYQGRIPELAAIEDPQQFEPSRNAVLKDYSDCLDGLPAYDPFSAR